MDDLVNVISNVGFPIAISAYLLLRLEGKIDTLAGNIGDLARVIEHIKDY